MEEKTNELWQCAVCEHWFGVVTPPASDAHARWDSCVRWRERAETPIAGRMLVTCTQCRGVVAALRSPDAHERPSKLATVREWLPPWAWNAMTFTQASILEHLLDDIEFREVRVRFYEACGLDPVGVAKPSIRNDEMRIEFHGLSIHAASQLSRIGAVLTKADPDEYGFPLAMALSITQTRTAMVANPGAIATPTPGTA